MLDFAPRVIFTDSFLAVPTNTLFAQGAAHVIQNLVTFWGVVLHSNLLPDIHRRPSLKLRDAEVFVQRFYHQSWLFIGGEANTWRAWSFYVSPTKFVYKIYW